jgi:hypothetical protein
MKLLRVLVWNVTSKPALSVASRRPADRITGDGKGGARRRKGRSGNDGFAAVPSLTIWYVVESPT